VADTAKSSCLFRLVADSFGPHKGLNYMYKRIVHSYVVRRYLTESTAEIIVLDGLYKQRS
jgi:hypothetical protein